MLLKNRLRDCFQEKRLRYVFKTAVFLMLEAFINDKMRFIPSYLRSSRKNTQKGSTQIPPKHSHPHLFDLNQLGQVRSFHGSDGNCAQ